MSEGEMNLINTINIQQIVLNLCVSKSVQVTWIIQFPFQVDSNHFMHFDYFCKKKYIMHKHSENSVYKLRITINVCIETMHVSRVQYHSKNETFSCINTIKFNWVVYERTMKSCNLIMIIGLIWLDDNFPIWMCARNFMRENCVYRERQAKKICIMFNLFEASVIDEIDVIGMAIRQDMICWWLFIQQWVVASQRQTKRRKPVSK